MIESVPVCQVEIEPEPTDEESCAVIAALMMHRGRHTESVVVAPERLSRWAAAGRREAHRHRLAQTGLTEPFPAWMEKQ